MQKATVILGVAASVLWSSAVFADSVCSGPTKDGNTWNLVCADDGNGDDEYQCNYTISVTNADGLQGQSDASGSVAKGQSGIIIWSDEEYESSNIVSANIVSGSCTAK